MNTNLRKLAHFYNEKFLYADSQYFKADIRNDVHIMVVEINTNVSNNLETTRNVTVRVSCTDRAYGQLKEISWTGLLQDWYKACASVVEDLSIDKISGKI